MLFQHATKSLHECLVTKQIVSRFLEARELTTSRLGLGPKLLGVSSLMSLVTSHVSVEKVSCTSLHNECVSSQQRSRDLCYLKRHFATNATRLTGFGLGFYRLRKTRRNNCVEDKISRHQVSHTHGVHGSNCPTAVSLKIVSFST